MEDVRHIVSNLLKDMLDEVKGAENYLEMAEKTDGVDHKRHFINMAHQEMEHYKALCDMLQEKMRMYPGEINIENNVVAKTLYDDMRHWKENVYDRIQDMMEELGM